VALRVIDIASTETGTSRATLTSHARMTPADAEDIGTAIGDLKKRGAITIAGGGVLTPTPDAAQAIAPLRATQDLICRIADAGTLILEALDQADRERIQGLSRKRGKGRDLVRFSARSFHDVRLLALAEAAQINFHYANDGLTLSVDETTSTDIVMTLTPHVLRRPEITEEDLRSFLVGGEASPFIFDAQAPTVARPAPSTPRCRARSPAPCGRIAILGARVSRAGRGTRCAACGHGGRG